MGLRPTNSNEGHVGGQFCPQPAFSRLRRAQFACAAKSGSAAGRVPAPRAWFSTVRRVSRPASRLAQRNRRAWTPAAGLEARPTCDLVSLCARTSEALCQFQPLQLDTIGVDVGKLILRLLHKPALGAAAENLGQSHGHFGGYAAFPVHQFRQRGAGHAEGGGGICDAQSQRLYALAQHEAAWVWWVLHRHGFPLSVVIDIINVQRVAISKAKNHPPVGTYHYVAQTRVEAARIVLWKPATIWLRRAD